MTFRLAFLMTFFSLAAFCLPGAGQAQTANSETSVDSTSPAPSEYEKVAINPELIPVGKWPERLAYNGKTIWVSESGQRTISVIDPTPGSREVVTRFKVGRLPVDMAAAPDGTVYALNNTDDQIWVRRTGEAEAVKYAPIPHCANNMTADSEQLWAISITDCTGGGYLYSVPHKTGKPKRVVQVSNALSDIKAAHGVVYIAQSTSNEPGYISIYNPASRQLARTEASDAHTGRLAANSKAVFLGGGRVEGQTGVIRKVNAGQSQITARRDVSEYILAIAATEESVVAVGRAGTIWVMSSDDLSIKREIRSSGPAISPHDALILGNTLFVASFSGNTEGDVYGVYAFDGWAPAGTSITQGPQNVAGPSIRPTRLASTEPAAEPEKPKKKAKPKKLYNRNKRNARGRCIGGQYYSKRRKSCWCPRRKRHWNAETGRCQRWRTKRRRAIHVEKCTGGAVLNSRGVCIQLSGPGELTARCLSARAKCAKTGGEAICRSAARWCEKKLTN